MDLVEIIKGQLAGGDTLSRLAGLIGAPTDSARAAVNAAVPTVLAGFSQVATASSDGARRLFSAVDGVDDSMSGDISHAFAGGGGKSMIESGTSMLNSLMGGGGTLSSIGTVLSKFTGLGSGAIMSLLGAITPAILGVLKSQKRSLGLDASGLANMLGSQQNNIMRAMPAGLGNMLSSVPGLSGISDRLSGAADWTRDRAGEAYDATRGAARAGAHAATAGASSAINWALPVIGVLALAALLWWAFSRTSRNAPEAIATQPPPKAVTDSRDATMASAVIPGLDQQVTTVRDQISGFFKSATDSVANITDPTSAEQALPKLRELNTKLDSMRSLVNALPTDARTSVTSTFESSWNTLKPAIDKVMQIPGVSDKLKPVIDEMTNKANALLGR